MSMTPEQGAAVARLFLDARNAAIGKLTRARLAEMANREIDDPLIDDHYISRLETGGQNPVASPLAIRKTRAVAKHLTVPWTEVLEAAGVLSEVDS